MQQVIFMESHLVNVNVLTAQLWHHVVCQYYSQFWYQWTARLLVIVANILNQRFQTFKWMQHVILVDTCSHVCRVVFNYRNVTIDSRCAHVVEPIGPVIVYVNNARSHSMPVNSGCVIDYSQQLSFASVGARYSHNQLFNYSIQFTLLSTMGNSFRPFKQQFIQNLRKII